MVTVPVYDTNRSRAKRSGKFKFDSLDSWFKKCRMTMCVCVCALNKLCNKCIMWMKKTVCIVINEVKWRKLQNIINIYFAQFLMFWHPSDDSIYSVQRIYQYFDSNWKTLRMSKKQFLGKKKEKHEITYRNPNKLITQM